MAIAAPTATAPRLLLSIDEACAALHISRAQLYRLMQSGVPGSSGVKIGSVKIGSRRLVPVAALEAYVFRLTQEADGVV